MKTYPFIRIIIRLYWLALIILLGLLVHPLYDIIWPIAPNNGTLVAELSDIKTSANPPELTTEIKLGKDLFKNNCGTCHNRNMKTDMTGPALGGVTERWNDYPKEDLYNWVKNALKMVEEGHPKAVEVYNKYNKMPMPAFNKFSDTDVEAILTYVESVK